MLYKSLSKKCNKILFWVLTFFFKWKDRKLLLEDGYELRNSLLSHASLAMTRYG
jgi:hypothetical protein